MKSFVPSGRSGAAGSPDRAARQHRNGVVPAPQSILVDQGANDRLALEYTAPLSFAQEHIWLAHQLQPDNAAYHVDFTVRLTGKLVVSALEQSLQEIVARHASLRTNVRLVDSTPVQFVCPEFDLPFQIVDLCTVPAERRAGELLRLASEEFNRPFDLAYDTLLRAALFLVAPDEHVLQVTVHRFAADKWAIALLAQELAALYAAFEQRLPSPLADLPAQYVDYAVWERKWLQGEVYEQQMAYWRERAADVPLLALPPDRPRPAVQTSCGAQVEIFAPHELIARLERFSASEGVALPATLLAAFQILLHRYTGQVDFAVGMAMPNRTQESSRHLIGAFQNTLPIRTDLSDNPSFRVFLHRTEQLAAEALQHQQLPFDMLAAAAEPLREFSHAPLFQAAFDAVDVPAAPLRFDGLACEYFALNKTGAQVDVTLDVYAMRQGTRFVLEYNSDLFDAGTIERMLAQYQVLLASVVDSPDSTVDRLPMLPAAEREQLLYEWNATEADYADTACIHQLFEAQAARTPDALAVVCEDQQITFAALDRRANQLAAYLRGEGIKPGTFVALCLNRSIDMMVALLGVLKAGGAYIPLDPAFPIERLVYMMQDARAPLLLTHAGLLPQLVGMLPEQRLRVVHMDSDWQTIAGSPVMPVTSPPTAEDIAYVIYTSGSTGKPKGVQVRHRNVVNLLLSMVREPGVVLQDTWLSVTTLSFDMVVPELYLPLITGAQLHLASKAVTNDGRRLAEYLTHSGATILQATPATWRLLIAAGWEGDRQLKALCGGEALPADLAQQLLERVGSLWNMYGPTETTVWSTTGQIVAADEPIVIGRPIANTQIYLLDANMQPVPTGVVGELYIGGDGVSLGYLNRPELTTGRFVSDPFRDVPGARLYRTGDLARYRDGGNIEFLGRADHQVKVRGFRIELGEVESALHEHPAVDHAVVTACEDGAGGKFLAAYIISASPTSISAAELRQFLAPRLPQYMLPSAVVPLAAFPLTPTGKVDRGRLPHPEHAVVSRSDTYSPPRTALELQLVQMWESVLGQGSIGIHDNFFEIGGHSLSAARLFIQIENQLGRQLPLATLLQAPTIAQLAAVMQDEHWVPHWSSLVPIQPLGSRPPFYCVHGYGGDVVGYRELANLLGTEQPFYGLQARGLNDADEPHRDIIEMAADYVTAIRKLQPEGPYYMGGYCYGGIVAFEMARILAAQGQRVGLVAIMDGYANDKAEMQRQHWRPGVLASFLRNLPIWLRDNLHPNGPYADRLPWGNKHAPAVLNNSQNVLRVTAADADSTVSGELLDFGARRAKLMVAHSRAIDQYRPSVYSGRVTLFRVKAMSLFRAHDPLMGWGAYAEDGVDVQMVAGAHYNILEHPNVQQLAAQLRSCIDKAANS